VFDRYNIVDERDVRDAFEKVTAYVETLPMTPTVVPIARRRMSTTGDPSDCSMANGQGNLRGARRR
jgi:hypothetical protein